MLLTFDQTVVLALDLTVAVIIAGVPMWLVLLWCKRRLPKAPTWLRIAVTAILAVVWSVVIYGAFIEPKRLVTIHHEVNVREDMESPERHLRLVVVSDMHFGFFKSRVWAEKLVSKISEQNPDALLIAGDAVSNTEGIKSLAAFRSVGPRLGKYFVLGNWDYHIGAVDVRRAFGSYGVKTLTNKSVYLDGLWLVGIDDLVFGSPRWDKALSAVPSGEPWVALVHEPDSALWSDRLGAGLTVAGHTHGGQIRLPFIGAVLNDSGTLGDKLDKGFYDMKNGKLLVTSGAGETATRARLFNPPEIVIIDVTY